VNEHRNSLDARSRLRTVLGDVHFWVPVAVLVGGLLVLRWIE
jgi:hypothetical protein